MNKKGFTLVELMVVIVIIGVLAAVAIPKFAAAQNKAKASEFPTMLSQIVAGEEANMAEVDEYVTAANADSLKAKMGIDISSSQPYFLYNVTASSSNLAFDATATLGGAGTKQAKLGTVDVGAVAYVNDQGVKGADGTGDASLSSLAKSYFN